MLPDAYPPRQRRHHSREFKRQLVDQCGPGVSVAGIAMVNGINTNLLQRWIRQHRAGVDTLPVRANAAIKLVPVSVQQEQPSSVGSMIEITLSGKRRSASLRWPVLSVAALATLLRGVLA